MTETLNKVFHQIEILPENEQNEIAQLLTQELNWENTFAKSQDFLETLANEATFEHQQGKTKKVIL
jgi:hypothetical protein